jgi:hypothetical protein
MVYPDATEDGSAAFPAEIVTPAAQQMPAPEMLGPGGMQRQPLGPGGMQRQPLGPGGMQRQPLGPGGMQRQPLGPGGMQRQPLGPGGMQRRPLGPGGMQRRPLGPGGMQRPGTRPIIGPDGKIRPEIAPGGSNKYWAIGPDYSPMFAPCNNVGIIGLVEFSALEKMGSVPSRPRYGEMKQFDYHKQRWGNENF